MIWIPRQDVSGRFETGLSWFKSVEDTSDDKRRLKKPVSHGDYEPFGNEMYEFAQNNWGRIHSTPQKAPDCFQDFTFQSKVVSKEIAQVIEALEPGVHQFVECPNIWSKAGNCRVDREFLLINVSVKFKTIDAEKSPVKLVRRRDGTEFYELSSMLSKDYVIDASYPRSCHLWRDTTVPKFAFMSEELKQRLEEVGARGFDFLPVTMPS